MTKTNAPKLSWYTVRSHSHNPDKDQVAVVTVLAANPWHAEDVALQLGVEDKRLMADFEPAK